MDANGREFALDQQTVQFISSLNRTDKNADLVELERIKQIIELAILFIFLELDVVLLQTVQSQFGFIIHKDFQWLEV